MKQLLILLLAFGFMACANQNQNVIHPKKGCDMPTDYSLYAANIHDETSPIQYVFPPSSGQTWLVGGWTIFSFDDKSYYVDHKSCDAPNADGTIDFNTCKNAQLLKRDSIVTIPAICNALNEDILVQIAADGSAGFYTK